MRTRKTTTNPDDLRRYAARFYPDGLPDEPPAGQNSVKMAMLHAVICEGMAYQDVGDRYGVTDIRVRQVVSNLLAKMCDPDDFVWRPDHIRALRIVSSEAAIIECPSVP